MTHRNLIGLLTLAGWMSVAAIGCSSQTDLSKLDKPALSPEPAHATKTSTPDVMSASIDAFTSRLEQTRHFQSAGDADRFQSSRDSLVDDVNNYIRLHPHAEDHPKFAQLLNSLSALDTLETDTLVNEDNYSAADDSLALANSHWPEMPSGGVTPYFTENTIFPTISNPRIDFWLTYFTGPGRERFERALYRMELHRPAVSKILDERDLPQELICIALIESGFATKAVSRAKAVGPWQFINGTARRYNLRVNWWYDERCDVTASTYAACNYLKDLYDIWGDWYLAFAAYNCGEFRVARQVARQKSENFWQLDLPLQTERYVPKFLAALYILRDPAKYGFTLPQVEPIRYDLVTVTEATDLDVLARCAGTTCDVIKDLNPQFRRGATPPNMEIQVRVPQGAGDTCLASLANLPASDRVAWKEHKVKRGETLSMIAGKYSTSVEAVRDANGLKRKSMLSVGQTLMIPVSGVTASPDLANSKPQYMIPSNGVDRDALQRYAQRAAVAWTAPPTDKKKIVHVVKPGDTLSEIAEHYHTSIDRIRSWNNLSRRRHIYAGQRLAIYVSESYQQAEVRDTASATQVVNADESRFEKTKHVVERGESLYSISKQFNVSVQDLMSWNGLSRSSIRSGDVIVVWTPRSSMEAGVP
ncbi:MAG TPA: LysM peptidoglycan-binding domain-containing protein [Candidatus Krumholzibacteria bacterium]|nr:LysM peptidoglycan-binding domain-containing protein [Candidatus Krumholzibacteria bacterium]